MVHLHHNPFETDSISSPSKPSAYRRRRLWKIIIRSSLVCTLITVCYFFGRSIQWGAFSENYGFSTKDIDFMRYFCSQIQTTPKHGLSAANSLAQLVADELEHHKVGYLNPSDTTPPDDTIPDQVWDDLPVKGAYYMVVRNENLGDARSVIKSMEDHMTNGTRYPWVFLNNQAFTADFKRFVKKVTNAPVFFGKIDLQVWEYPHWIDIPRAEYLMLQQEMRGAHRGASLSYHQLLRYHAGYFFHHPLLRNVEYTWRVEPGADYSCQMDQDMFLFMKQQQKKLGFVLTMRESPATVPTLWTRINEFKDYYPEYILPHNETIWPWIVEKETNEYNMCHLWSNFQLADLSFFRSEAYQQYFKYLDNTGNFFYERWSDAPVQTIAAALFMKKQDIHFFNEIGYSHTSALHCPYSETLLKKCSCDVTSNYDLYQDSCTKKLLKLIDPETLSDMTNFIQEKQIEIPSKIE
ncbi:unnamed protein product [Mucor circinelloides]